jgi:hypothetical protein
MKTIRRRASEVQNCSFTLHASRITQNFLKGERRWGQRWQTIDGLRFVFHPAANPFLSLLLERAKHQPEPFLKLQIGALAFVGVVSLLAMIVVELLKVPLLLKGG